MIKINGIIISSKAGENMKLRVFWKLGDQFDSNLACTTEYKYSLLHEFLGPIIRLNFLINIEIFFYDKKNSANSTSPKILSTYQYKYF
jgi:hypothetical protein